MDTFLMIASTLCFAASAVFGCAAAWSAFRSLRPKKMPAYRLTPDGCGTYTLQKWHSGGRIYLTEAQRITKEDADAAIENLERDTVYYREGPE